MLITNPGKLWYLSSRLHRRGWKKAARLIKAYNFLVFRAILPPQAELAAPVSLGHFGLNVVVHPNVTIGENVHLWHSVTLAVSESPGGAARIVLGSNITIGTGAVVVSREKETLRIASDVRVGANAVVTRSIISPGTYNGAPAKRMG